MHLLVTGGAGYVGSIVTEALVRNGHRVIVYDNLSRGHRDAVISPATLVEADLLDPRTLRSVLGEHRIDAVVHLADDSLAGESMQDPSKYYRDLQAGLSLLDMMKLSGVEQLIFSSSSAVYGEPLKQPIEETDPLQPINPYGDTKLAFERALQWYGHAYGLRSVSLRYFNVAGASARNGERHEPETHLIPSVLRVAFGQTPVLRIFGDDYPTKDGTSVRDFVHVEDLADAHVLAVEALQSRRALSAAYNLGIGHGYSVREVVDTAQLVTGRLIATQVVPPRPGDSAVLVASSDRIKNELGWKPSRRRLDEIIDSAWRWMYRREQVVV